MLKSSLYKILKALFNAANEIIGKVDLLMSQKDDNELWNPTKITTLMLMNILASLEFWFCLSLL